MSRKTDTFKIFISSPSDVANERQIVKKTVASVSRTLAARNIALETFLWEENTTSDFGGAPQDAIMRQLGSYDFYIGLMDSAFGTATAHFGSGTEEEFHHAMQTFADGKLQKIGFFFKKSRLDTSLLSEQAITQLGKVVAFRNSLIPKGIYKFFENDSELQTLVTEFLHEFFERKLESGPEDSQKDMADSSLAHSPISSSFYRDFLNNIDNEIAGSNSNISLHELWIELELKASQFKKGAGFSTEYYDSTRLVQECKTGKCFHLTGNETAGKTGLCTKLFLRLHNDGLYPVYVSGTEIKSADTDRLLSRIALQMSQQYYGLSQADAKKISKKRIVILLDDFDHINLNTRVSLGMLNFLKSSFLSVYITTSVSYSFSVLESTDDVTILGHFRKVELQELGNKKRYDLIENWCRCKAVGQIDETKLRNEVEKIRIEINRILITHIVPRTPLIILILLRAIDNSQSSDLAQSGYVRYYKFLIDNAVLRNLRIDEAEQAYALLPEIAWAMYQNGTHELLTEVAETVVEEFSKRRALRKSTLYSVLERLRQIGMFQKESVSYKFKHPYVYNFFLADYISQNLTQSRMQEHVKALCESSLSRESANILIFLSFHSNDAIIINTLVDRLRQTYKATDEFDFSSKSTELINKLINAAPSHISDQASTKEARDSRLKTQDEIEESASKNREAQKVPLNEMESLFASIEVLGHILRNHYARLDAQPKRIIFEEATSAILRCTGYFIGFLSDSSDLLVSYLSGALKIYEGDVEKQEFLARQMLFLLATAFLYYCGKILSQAVGDENLEITYLQAIENVPATAKRYLDAIIKLDCFLNFPVKELEIVVGLLSGSHIGMAALRIAVSERLDMRPPSTAADFRKFCQIVGLKEVTRLAARQRLGSKVETDAGIDTNSSRGKSK
jgi:predicted transcriptional regulator